MTELDWSRFLAVDRSSHFDTTPMCTGHICYLQYCTLHSSLNSNSTTREIHNAMRWFHTSMTCNRQIIKSSSTTKTRKCDSSVTSEWQTDRRTDRQSMIVEWPLSDCQSVSQLISPEPNVMFRPRHRSLHQTKETTVPLANLDTDTHRHIQILHGGNQHDTHRHIQILHGGNQHDTHRHIQILHGGNQHTHTDIYRYCMVAINMTHTDIYRYCMVAISMTHTDIYRYCMVAINIHSQFNTLLNYAQLTFSCKNLKGIARWRTHVLNLITTSSIRCFNRHTWNAMLLWCFLSHLKSRWIFVVDSSNNSSCKNVE